MSSHFGTLSHEDLSWGHGPKVMEIFLEPTCPFSGRAFLKLMPLLEAVGSDRLTVKIRLNSQPWHTFSSVVSRAILAASSTDGGKEAAYRVMAAVFEHREDYILAEHCRGPNMDCAPAEILRRLAEHSGLDLRIAFEHKELTNLMKLHARYARQNGVHATPTFMVEGLVNDKMSSGGEIDAWMAELGLEEKLEARVS
jgi:protein-disulfide isomerase